jgi:hypothetical protein
MGQQEVSTSDNTTIKVTQLPKLSSDGENWLTYHERVFNAATARGLRRHLVGTALKPSSVVEKDGKYYLKLDDPEPLAEDALDKHEASVDSWEQKEAQVRELIYNTVDNSTFLQIKGEKTAADLWKKLTSIHGNKGAQFEEYLLGKLQTARYTESDDMRTHLTTMNTLRERLSEIGSPISDVQFNAYIRTSLSLVQRYQPLLTTLSTTARQTKSALSSSDLVWHLVEEANTMKLEASVNKSHAALAAANGRSNKGSSDKGRSRDKRRKPGRSGAQCTNTNCKSQRGHTIEDCFAKGGGKEHEAPDWFKKRQEAKAKETKKESANSAAETSSKRENHAYVTVGPTDLIHQDEEASTALVITSGHNHEAFGVSPSTDLIVDCGASSHFSPDKSKFINFEAILPEPIRAADGHTFSAIGCGDLIVTLPTKDGETGPPITLKRVYYAPKMAFTLVSVACLDKAGCSLTIEDGECIIRSPRPYRTILGSVPRVDNLYRLSSSAIQAPDPPIHYANIADGPISINELHRRMGHVNFQTLREMIREGAVEGVELDSSPASSFCESCVQGKAHRKAFPKVSETTYSKYGEKVVTDLWGPAQVQSLGGHSYAHMVEDLYSREPRVSFLKAKSEAFESYKQYEAWVKAHRNPGGIACLGSDRGGEFIDGEFKAYLQSVGTIRHLNVHDSPQSNGVIERLNQTLIESARAMLFEAGLPPFLWAEAVHHAAWLRARVPSRALPGCMTPIERATGRKPNLKKVLVFGAVVWVRVKDAGKLEPQAVEGHFVGYDEESKGYRIFFPRRRSVIVERDVYFDKEAIVDVGNVVLEGETEGTATADFLNPTVPVKALTSAPETHDADAPNATETIPISAQDGTQPSIPTKPRRNSLDGLQQYDPQQYGRGKSRRAGKTLGETALVVEGHDGLEASGAEFENPTEAELLHEAVHEAMSAVTEDQPPIESAINGPESDQWKQALKEELDQIEKLGTWEFVEAPDNANIIPCRWVLRRKRNAQGEISRYKARLVAKGFRQQFGVDYTDTFAPTVRPATLRILLALGAAKGDDIIIEQADVKNAYLNAWMHDDEVVLIDIPKFYELFRQLPEAFKKLIREGKRVVLRLKRPLYGTKQGAHHWYEELKRILLLLGFRVSNADEAMFYKVDGDRFLVLAAATDDFTIVTNSRVLSTETKTQLNQHFELVELGPINWLLGVSVTRNLKDKTLALGQQAYIEQIIARFGLSNARPDVTPMEPGADYHPDSSGVSPTLLTPAEKTTYREMIGSLMYCATMTRPDIAYAVSTLSQFLEAPRSTHMKAVKRVFCYLLGTKKLKLVLGGNLDVTGFSDADWASQRHRHSISGFAYFVGLGTVSWSAKKQPIITLSSTEAEYVALTHAAKDILWIHKLLKEVTFLHSLSLPTILYCDNQGAIRLSKDATFHGRTKHIDVHFHFIRQTITSGNIELVYIPTEDMTADIFTKSLARVKFEKFRDELNVI